MKWPYFFGVATCRQMAKGNDYFDEEITMSKVVDMIFMQTNADNKGE